MTMKQVIIAPRVTEKGDALKNATNQYVFEVDRMANKLEIKEAVESLGKNVKVECVRTLMVAGKPKRAGRVVRKTPAWKKAIVRLKEGSKLEFFEGV
jgi:large subunit ribosomal protein L23